MNFNVIVTSGFKKQAKSIGKKHLSLKSDIESLISSLEKKPTQGEPLCKDFYKIQDSTGMIWNNTNNVVNLT